MGRPVTRERWLSRGRRLDAVQGAPEDVAGVIVEQDEVDLLDRGFGLQVLGGLVEHDRGALLDGKAGNARTDGGKSDGLQAALGGDAQRMRDGGAEVRAGGAPAELHAGGVNHVAGR